MIANRIIELASEWVNTPERVGNRLPDELTGILMRYSNWKPGQSYCSAFSSAMFIMAHEQEGIPIKEFAAVAEMGQTNSVMGAWIVINQLAECKSFIKSHPVPGAIGFFSRGDEKTGHTVIVKECSDPNRIITIEGNTTRPGSQIQGIYEKTRDLSRITTWMKGGVLGWLHPLKMGSASGSLVSSIADHGLESLVKFMKANT
jgi:hypothetical protein